MLVNSAASKIPVPVKKEESKSKGFISKIVDKFEHAGKSINDYTKPRFDFEKKTNTTGDMPESSAMSAAVSGAINSFFTMGPAAIPSGVVSGIVGVKAGEKAGFGAALLASALTGAATGAVTGAIIAGPAGAAGFAVAGALNGVAATLYGSAKASTRDGAMGGSLLGYGIMGPAGALVGSVAGGIGGKAVDDVGRGVLGALAGAVIGGAVGIIGGPVGMIVGALKGAIIGASGAVIGSRLNQANRNFKEDFSNFLDKKLEPHKKNIKLSKWQKVGLGALAMAAPLAFAGGRLFGIPGAVAGSIFGGLSGAKAIMSTFKKKVSPEMNKETEVHPEKTVSVNTDVNKPGETVLQRS